MKLVRKTSQGLDSKVRSGEGLAWGKRTLNWHERNATSVLHNTAMSAPSGKVLWGDTQKGRVGCAVHVKRV